jgi:hypothetical protein
MSKKSRRRAARVRSAPAKLPPEAAERKARQDLVEGRYREAVEGFKQLLKLETRRAWRTALADAYAGRARELAAKGMIKEALAIWDNRSNLGADIAFDPDQAALLLRMGRVSSMLPLLLAQAIELPPAQRDRLRSILAAAYLAGAEAVAEQLPADDPMLLHAESARAALTAYCAGDDQALQTALAEIPFRSPYRDWVQILKALQRSAAEPEEAARLLARVPEGSAFFPLRRAAELALLPEAAFLPAIRTAGTRSVRFACLLRGWPQARIALWEELSQLGAEPRPETLLRLMVRHRDALGSDWILRQRLRLLVEGYPASRKLLKAAGAPPLSAEERLLLAAWSAERGGDLWEEQDRWESYARHLMNGRSHAGQESERNLRIALALRRCDRLGKVLSKADPSTDLDGIQSLIARQVEESLIWDPEDRDTYLRLIGYYRRGKQLKDVRRLLKQARDRWPKDMQVLEADLDTTLETGAFKKASGLARQMLALDSINSAVRERLVQAHLAHARKQVAKGRSDLARKELTQAREWARSPQARDQLDLTSGLITLIEDAKRGSSVLVDLVKRLGSGLAGHLTLALAGEALKLSPRRLFARMGIEMPAVAGRDDLLATLAGLRRHLDGGGSITTELGSYLSKALAKSPWGDLSKSEMEAACETLRRYGLGQSRLIAARAALKRWKGEPVFELHAFEAKYSGRYGSCSDKDIERLEDSLDRARKEGDTRIAMRIEAILADLDPFPFGPMPFPPPPAGEPAPPISGVETIGLLIETLGLEKAMTAMGLPPDIKRDLRKIARQQGDEAVAEALGSFLDIFSDFAEEEICPPIPPRPPGGKPSKPRRGRRQAPSGSDKAQDDDPSDQLDLFR